MGSVALERKRTPARLTRRHLFLLPAVVIVAAAALGPIEDNSFLWHVRAGELQLESGEVLRSDPFSFTRFGEPWLTQSWLAELAYGGLEAATGGLRWVGPMIAILGLVMLGFSGLAVYARNRRLGPVILGLTVLALGFLYFSVPRPVLVSFALLAALMVVLAHPERLAWTLVPLLWLWAVLHATWVIAIAVIVLEVIRRRSVSLAGAGGAATLATLLTPHGLDSWRFAFDLSSNREALAFLSEWQPPDFTSIVLWPFLVVVVGIVVAAVRGRIEMWDLAVVVPVLLLGLMQERTVFVATILLLPYAAAAMGGGQGEQVVSGDKPALNWVLVGILAVALVMAFAADRVEFDDRFPTGLAEQLQADAVFHGAGVGGYLIYVDGPERKVYIDDRAELYGGSGFGEFVDASRGVGYREVFARYAISEAVAELEWPLVTDLEEDGWVRVAEEGDYVLMRAP